MTGKLSGDDDITILLGEFSLQTPKRAILKNPSDTRQFVSAVLFISCRRYIHSFGYFAGLFYRRELLRLG